MTTWNQGEFFQSLFRALRKVKKYEVDEKKETVFKTPL